MDLANRLYAQLPVGLQNAAFSTFGLYWHWLRFGPGHARQVALFREREKYSGEEWDRWLTEELEKLLTVCCDSVPFYRERWTLHQKAAAREGRLQDLPLLEKDEVRQHARSMMRTDRRPLKLLHMYTSGTTGTPVKTSWTVGEVRRSLAVREVRAANWAGVSYSLPRATFSGRAIVPDPDSSGPFLRYNAVERQVYLSPYHLRPGNARRYLEPLFKHKTVWLNGYASSYYILARYMLDQGLEPPPTLKAVVTVAEKLTPSMRDVMERAYRCPVYEEYGAVEDVCYGTQCERGRMHVSPDAGVVEILRPDGSPCPAGEEGEIVCTGLLRDYQPLVRYRIGDLGVWDGEPCPCGRALPVIREIVGRINDVVVGPDGRRLTRFNTVFEHIEHILEGQIVQEEYDLISVNVVPDAGFGPADADGVVREVRLRLGSGVRVQVN